MGAEKLASRELVLCILGGISILMAVVTLLVSVCAYVPAIDAVTSTREFQSAVFFSLLASIALLLSTSVFASHAYQRFVFCFVVLSMTASLASSTHFVSSKAVVVVSLLTASLLTAAFAYLGVKVEDASFLGPPLVACLVLLILVGLLNSFVLHAHWVETAFSVVAVALFCAFSVYDANRFAKNPVCRHNCCEEGVFSLYLNFANVAMNLMRLSGD